MCPRYTDDTQEVDFTRKTAVIDRELHRLNLDIVGLQETRLPDAGSIREANYTFFWQGKSQDEPRLHGVGFAVKNTLLNCIVPPSGGTERILTLQMHSSSGTINILNVYAPTLSSSVEEKDQFYELLSDRITQVPVSESLYILGDFNSRVGSDNDMWPTCLGHHGVGKMNANGQRLLEMCCFHGLCITNTYFQLRDRYKVTWRHPRSHHWHQLDLVLARRTDLKNVLLTRSYHSADCNTDHTLVASRLRLTPKKYHHTKQTGHPRINTCNVHNSKQKEEFASSLESALAGYVQAESNIDNKWAQLSGAIYNSAVLAYGIKEKKNKDWYEQNLEEMVPVIEAKRRALLAYKRNPNVKTRDELRQAKNKAQQTSRRCANNYWLNLCAGIQKAADSGDAKGMYDGIKKAIGPTVKKTAPLKTKTGEVITDEGKQMERWVEHYLELYAAENEVSREALDAIQQMPVMEELDAMPTMEELSRAIDSLANGKAPGEDGIPAEIIKYNKSVLLEHLHSLLTTIWEEGYVPLSMRNSKIVTLYKHKGDRSDCNNYRGISLLSVAGKAYARVILMRLHILASRIYPESQCGFRPGRSTVDMIFSLRQLQEKCREQQRPLYIAFIDLVKAFDLVSRNGLFKLLQKIGCPPKLLQMAVSFHEKMQATVCFNGKTSEAFPVNSGVKQGCVLAPTLFGIFFSLLLRFAFKDCEKGVYLHTRSDGNLFNIARLKAKTKVNRIVIRELLYADDAALVANTEDELQYLITKLSNACREFGLTISLQKTKIMAQGTTHLPSISIDGNPLQVVDDFTYLGSTICNNLSVDNEITNRIAKASAIMGKLKNRVWNNGLLTIKTKLQVYNACVISTLLYGCETWTTLAKHESRLNSFHLRCLRRILQISWRDKVPNTEVLQLANTTSIHALLSHRRLRWLGHVRRMDHERIPKKLLYGELQEGVRRVGRPHLRFKDVCKRDLTKASINPSQWERIADDRVKWRLAARSGVNLAEDERMRQQVQKRTRRKERAASVRSPSHFTCPNCSRDCHSRVGLFSHSRRCKL